MRIKFSKFCEKNILLQGKITQKYLGLRTWNLQGIIFISTWTYKTNFKSALGYQGRVEHRKLGYIISIRVFPARESGAEIIPCVYIINLIMYIINTVKTFHYMFVLYIISAGISLFKLNYRSTRIFPFLCPYCILSTYFCTSF